MKTKARFSCKFIDVLSLCGNIGTIDFEGDDQRKRGERIGCWILLNEEDGENASVELSRREIVFLRNKEISSVIMREEQ